MNKSNLYWAVYKNLEKEVIELSYNIYFDDKQFEYVEYENKEDENKDGEKKEKNYIKTPPYSLKAGDLLVRCCTEIEALVKELTRDKSDDEIKATPFVDDKKAITTGCRLKYLHWVWALNKKIVSVSCSNMFFQNESNKSFAPFGYSNQKDDINNYYTAYNVIKHDRNEQTIYRGNIRSLLRAMASLYLLNIYYANIIKIVENSAYIPIERLSFSNRDLLKLDLTFGSEIFQIFCSHKAIAGITDDGVLHIDAEQGECEHCVAISVERKGDKFSDSDIRELYDKLNNEFGSRAMR
jgi:hypothetical protein